MTQELRAYQQQCLDAIKSRYREGVRRQLVCLPTGAGKTVIFSHFPSYFRMKKRMLVLAHREELLEQALDKLIKYNPSLTVEIEQGAHHASQGCDVVVASVATLGRADSKRLLNLDPDSFSIVVVDEAHHSVASTYQRCLEHLGVFVDGTRKLLVGFTATPKRGDAHGLDEVYQEIVCSRSLPELVADGYLAPLAGWRVETDVDLGGVPLQRGEYNQAKLSAAVNVRERNHLVVDAYKQKLRGRPTLCFCVDVEHAQKVCATFRAAGVTSSTVTGEMDRTYRFQTLKEFKAGNIDVLTNCMVLSEGYDESSVSGIIVARPTRSAALYAQLVGRGTRLHPGKANAVVIDVVDAATKHKAITLPTLFGMRGDFDLSGRTTQQAEDAFEWVHKHRPWVRTDLSTSIDDLKARCVEVNLMDLEPPDDVKACSVYAWMPSAPDVYTLTLGSNERMEVERTILGRWEAALIHGDVRKPLSDEKTMASAIRQSDLFVSQQRKHVHKLALRETHWRGGDATEKQWAMLKRMKVPAPKDLTRGQAAQLIALVRMREAS